jgi:hypothetical protein
MVFLPLRQTSLRYRGLWVDKPDLSLLPDDLSMARGEALTDTCAKKVDVYFLALVQWNHICLRNRRPGFESLQGVRFLGKKGKHINAAEL